MLSPLPVETAQRVSSRLKAESIYIRIGDQTEAVYRNVHLVVSEPSNELIHSRLLFYSLVAALQFAEDLSDSQANEAIRTRLEWKYALHLPLSYPGFSENGLCLYRRWAFHQEARQQALQALLDNLWELGLFTASSPAHPPEMQTALKRTCILTRTEWVFQGTRQAIERLAATQGDWLRQISLPHWYIRYAKSNAQNSNRHAPAASEIQLRYYGSDIRYLLNQLESADIAGLKNLDEIQKLHQIWGEQFSWNDGEVKLKLPYCSAYC